jgi:carbamoyltransferase
MSVILGINAFHADSAACLVVDGVLVSAIAEERLGKRVKHDPSFPATAIRRVLAEGGFSLSDVTHVAIARDTGANKEAKVKYVLTNLSKSYKAVIEHFLRRQKMDDVVGNLAEICSVDPATVRFEIVNVEHHLAHIASSYYVSPLRDGVTAGFSYDASGDFVSGMAARCEGDTIEILDKVHLPHSLGFFYTAICQYIGFDEFGEEYKVMGLAPYGEDKYQEQMRELVSWDESCWYRLNTKYFGMHEGGESGGVDERGHIVMGRLYREGFQELFGGPARKRDQPLTQREMDIAKSCQKHFEKAAIHCMNRLHSLVPTDQLVLAGGCALNGVTNARILRETPFKKMYIQCAASDDGTAIGAAYSCYHNVLGQKKRFHMYQAYLGPSYSDEVLTAAASTTGFPTKIYGDDVLFDHVAGLIASGKVVGWYQGASEWGPRALGNRSILGDPTRLDMKDVINKKIKKRESFRPFAPTVLMEHVGDYFEQDILSPFMMHVVKVREEWREKMPAITHVDGTARIQSIERSTNPRYYELIDAFRRITGVAVLLNTSFNENEPIVDTPQQAVDCFLRTDMDVLVLGNNVIEK